MGILGPNMQELLQFCDNNFSLKTILLIAVQMISRIQVLHDLGYLHRDLKPESIVIGQCKKAAVVHLTDFTMVKRYVCPNSGQHLKHLPNRGVVGTKKYLSLNANVGNELSRADDLIALGTILVCLFRKGNLPWDMPELPPFLPDSKDPLIF